MRLVTKSEVQEPVTGPRSNPTSDGGSSPHRIGASRGRCPILLTGAATCADGADEPAIDDDWHAAFGGNRTRVVGEAHEAGIAGGELVRKHLARATEKRRRPCLRVRQPDRRVLRPVRPFEVDEIA